MAYLIFYQFSLVPVPDQPVPESTRQVGPSFKSMSVTTVMLRLEEIVSTWKRNDLLFVSKLVVIYTFRVILSF
jgi:hypothetical protein